MTNVQTAWQRVSILLASIIALSGCFLLLTSAVDPYLSHVRSVAPDKPATLLLIALSLLLFFGWHRFSLVTFLTTTCTVLVTVYFIVTGLPWGGHNTDVSGSLILYILLVFGSAKLVVQSYRYEPGTYIVDGIATIGRPFWVTPFTQVSDIPEVEIIRTTVTHGSASAFVSVSVRMSIALRDREHTNMDELYERFVRDATNAARKALATTTTAEEREQTCARALPCCMTLNTFSVTRAHTT